MAKNNKSSIQPLSQSQKLTLQEMMGDHSSSTYTNDNLTMFALQNCTSIHEIDVLLTSLGVEDCPKSRTEFLFYVMKVRAVFRDDRLSDEDKYQVMKEQFVVGY